MARTAARLGTRYPPAGGSRPSSSSTPLTQLAEPALESRAAVAVVGLGIPGTGASVPAGVRGAVLPLTCKTRMAVSPWGHGAALPTLLTCQGAPGELRAGAHAVPLVCLPTGQQQGEQAGVRPLPGLGPCCSRVSPGLTLALCLAQLQCQTALAGHLHVLQLHWSLRLWATRGSNVTSSQDQTQGQPPR